MIVVSDTSPLNYLVIINEIDVLPKLFGDIYVPTQVIAELQRTAAPTSVRNWANSPPDWLRIISPAKTIVTSVRLDAGETQAIALAVELDADTILIDDRKGRRVAEQYGFNAVGTITVLEFAAERKLLDLKQSFEALRSTTFYIADEYFDAALQRDAARRLAE